MRQLSHQAFLNGDMRAMPVAGAAPCQCFSPVENPPSTNRGAFVNYRDND